MTTADPELKPPMLTVNTVLSLMAVDYPGAVHKLACYVSDDACSPLIFFALTEAAKFAQLWVPYCQKYGIQVRVPFRYFSPEQPSSVGGSDSSEFQQEWRHIKVTIIIMEPLSTLVYGLMLIVGTSLGIFLSFTD